MSQTLMRLNDERENLGLPYLNAELRTPQSTYCAKSYFCGNEPFLALGSATFDHVPPSFLMGLVFRCSAAGTLLLAVFLFI